MRIEPTSNSYPQRDIDRRHHDKTLKSKRGLGNNIVGKNRSAESLRRAENLDARALPVALEQTNRNNPSSARRWRSFTPFIAQYIGQETAIETIARAARRRPGPARNAYNQRMLPVKKSTTLAHV